MQALFAKNKRVQFQTKLTVESLIDVPLIRGRFYVKYKVRKSVTPLLSNSRQRTSVVAASTEAPQIYVGDADVNMSDKGRTQSEQLQDHAVVWNHQTVFNVTMTVNKSQALQPATLVLSVKKEVMGGKKQETFGKVYVDLSDFVSSKIPQKQYLLQESKSNSTLKLSIEMKQVQGDVLSSTRDEKQPHNPIFMTEDTAGSDVEEIYKPCNYGETYGPEFAHVQGHDHMVKIMYDSVMECFTVTPSKQARQ